ncbi:MAG: energy-coupling factor ABC transporter permease [Betaproteobacteria bacterium]
MNIPDTLLSAGWFWAAWVVWGLVAAAGVRRAPWGALRDPARFNVWLGMVVLLTVLWSLKAGVKPGLDFHFVGAALFTLSVGSWLAFFGLSLVTAGAGFGAETGFFAFGLNALLVAGAGPLISVGLLRLAECHLPRQPFVYIFANGFFGAWLAVIGIGCCAAAILALDGAYTIDYLGSEYLPYVGLLGFAEAWLSGMMVTIFVIYRPSWISTFNDARYLDSQQK